MKNECTEIKNHHYTLTWTGIFEIAVTLIKRLAIVVVTDGIPVSVFCNAAIVLNMIVKKNEVIFIQDTRL